MCVPNFSCPLCCNETFESINSLKYHILSLTDNLFCPVCKDRFDKVGVLVDHLTQHCKNDLEIDPSDLNETDIGDGDVLDLPDPKGEIFVDNADQFSDDNADEFIGEIEPEIQEIDDDDIGQSILARALLSDRKNVQFASVNVASSTDLIDTCDTIDTEIDSQQIEETEENAGDQSSQYFCQLCNVSLDSIEEHLQMFHAGQDIIVQPECLDIEANDVDVAGLQLTEFTDETIEPLTTQEDESSFYIINSSDIACLIENQEKEQEIEENITPSRTHFFFTKTPETITEEECVDKDGRAYTRKVVKIGQFWNQLPGGEKVKNREPTVEKFIIDEDGKPKQITKEEEDLIEEKDSIITLHVCPICHLQYSELQNFYSHICNMNASKRYICSECDSEFYGPRALCAHMKLHSKNKIKPKEKDIRIGPFNCEHCKTEFQTVKSLRLHARMHQMPIREKRIEPPVTYVNGENGTEEQQEVRETFTCTLCDKVFDKEYETIHVDSHNGKTLSFDCNVCNRKLHSQENLDMHMKAHLITKRFSCSYCKKSFVTYDALSEHVVEQCQKRQYECQYCGRRFARPHEKVKHERIHTGEKPHICEVCGKAFRVSYCLTLHMRTHSGMRPYHCAHCGKRFKSHSVFNHHLLTHSKERNYKCPFCSKAFKTSVQLAGHKNSHIKPFTCTECNRPFASLYAVRTHMETHKRNNNLKFGCWICGATYARTFALRDHMREQHEHHTEKISANILSVTEAIDATNSILSVSDDDILIDVETNGTSGAIKTMETD